MTGIVTNEELLKRLLQVRSSATTLITYWFPRSYQVEQAKNHVALELTQTSNIKEGKVAKSVTRTLNSLSNYLKELDIFHPTV